MQAGRRDLERAAEALATRLPEPLGVLARLAYNYRWAWDPDGPERLPRRSTPTAGSASRRTRCGCCRRPSTDAARARPPATPSCSRAPRRSRSACSADLARPRRDGLDDAGAPDRVLLRRVRLPRLVPDLLRRPRRARRRHPQGGLRPRAGRWSRVGLLYRHGYFRQRIDAGGWQHEYWVDTDPDRLPAALVTGDDGEPITITRADRRQRGRRRRSGASTSAACRCSCSTPSARRTTQTARWITSRLYIGDEDTRLAQYMLLGIGGVRALEALGIEPGIVHLNEGHAAFVVARARAPRVQRRRARSSAALEIARERTIFTTHTPVPAGNDTYPRRAGRATRSRTSPARSASTPRRSSASAAPTPTRAPSRSASRSSRCARAAPPTASAAATARSRARCGSAMWPDRAVDDVPITHVTNGVHIPTWLGQPMWELLDRHLGEDWLDARDRPGDLGAGRRHPRRGAVGRPHARSARS